MCLTFAVMQRDFYPRPPRGGRPVTFITAAEVLKISIHALREEGDPPHERLGGCTMISIHALREEGDRWGSQSEPQSRIFLSTPSARRATTCSDETNKAFNISIHALREEGDSVNLLLKHLFAISIHALREEGDRRKRFSTTPTTIFLSTPSARRATRGYAPSGRYCSYFYPRPPRGGRPTRWRNKNGIVEISIHALREEGDLLAPMGSNWKNYFYPHPPRGGRHGQQDTRLAALEFLSTPSARRATRRYGGAAGSGTGISIHALREEGDPRSSTFCTPIGHFYPRPPRGGRPFAWPFVLGRNTFLSTPSARRATAETIKNAGFEIYFYPRPPRGGRPMSLHSDLGLFLISIHALREEGDLPLW